MTEADIHELSGFLEDSQWSVSEDSKSRYGRDETEDLWFEPELVVKPSSVEQVSQILAYCNAQRIPVTVRGAGTGLSGGALPISGGVLMSMEYFNNILDIDEENLQATIEPGVITQVFQEAVMEKGLFYPPDPASKGSCFIGGNLAENSGGPKAVKYGVTKDYVLNLEVVLATGEVIWTGANVLKNATGFNLTQLFVGSEGLLGVITKAVFRLIPNPTRDLLMLVPFKHMEDACVVVAKIFAAGVTPSGLEFMERDALEFAMEYVSDVDIWIAEDDQAHLLIEVDGFDMEVLQSEMEKILGVVEQCEVGEILFADNVTDKDKLWRVRRCLGEAVKANSIYKEEDTVVPRAKLPELLMGVKKIGADFGFRSVCYGHAGDGNLHINILKGDLSDEQWNVDLKAPIREIFELCHQLGGTISGEHGIGLVQKEYMDVVFSDRQLQIQKGIKAAFDPHHILNPGKVFPD